MFGGAQIISGRFIRTPHCPEAGIILVLRVFNTCLILPSRKTTRG